MHMDEKQYLKGLRQIAVPAAIQSLFLFSFSIVDQLMISALGETAISAVNIGSRYGSIFLVISNAIIGGCGIFLAQYFGAGKSREFSASFFWCLQINLALSILMMVPGLIFARNIAAFYLDDSAVQDLAVSYLHIYSFVFVLQTLLNMTSVLMRTLYKSIIPMIATLAGVVLNTLGNWCLISGHLGFPALHVQGAAISTLFSTLVSLIIVIVCVPSVLRQSGIKLRVQFRFDRSLQKIWIRVLFPLVVCEALWTLAENIYAVAYGECGTFAFSAMSLANVIVGLVIGLLSGLSQAAGTMCGQLLGQDKIPAAEETGKKLVHTGLVCSVGLSVLVVLFAGWYVRFYAVEAETANVARNLLYVFALYAPVKTLNMIIGGGILRAGGNTRLVMWLESLTIWLVGVPLALLSAFVWHLPVTWVYAILSLEEAARLAAVYWIFRFRPALWTRRIAT